MLDCSKLQLGRGRIDDTVASFRRRLELFRELTLPMLKKMDTAERLIIVMLFFLFKNIYRIYKYVGMVRLMSGGHFYSYSKHICFVECIDNNNIS